MYRCNSNKMFYLFVYCHFSFTLSFLFSYNIVRIIRLNNITMTKAIHNNIVTDIMVRSGILFE